jgi:hypothetical protein
MSWIVRAASLRIGFDLALRILRDIAGFRIHAGA